MFNFLQITYKREGKKLIRKKLKCKLDSSSKMQLAFFQKTIDFVQDAMRANIDTLFTLKKAVKVDEEFKMNVIC